MAFDMEVCMKQRGGTEFLHAEKIVPTDIHHCLLNTDGDQSVDVSTVRQWVMCFSSGNRDMKDTEIHDCLPQLTALLLYLFKENPNECL